MKRFLLLLILLLTLTVPIAAQDDPTATVLDAFASLTNGYHFTYEADMAQTLTPDTGSETITYTRYAIEGDVAPGGDFAASVTLTGADSPDTATATEVVELAVERVQVDGVDYIQIGEDNGEFDFLSEVEPGWHRLDDLQSEFAMELVAQAVLQSVATVTLPGDIPVTAANILTVTEADPAEIDGQPVRVFDITLDGRRLMTGQGLQSGAGAFEDLPQAAAILAAGTFDYTLTISIADDGHILHIAGAYETVLPYNTIESDNLPPFDLTQSGTFQYDLTAQAAVDPIAPPIS